MSFKNILAEAEQNGVTIYKTDKGTLRFNLADEVPAEMFKYNNKWFAFLYPSHFWNNEQIISGSKSKVARQCLSFCIEMEN